MRSILYARISDNVLDEEDWPIRKLVIENERIVEHEDRPMRGLPAMGFEGGPETGWSLDQLLAWSSLDSTGKHPEVYHDLKAEGDDAFDFYVYRRDRLDEMLKRGKVE